VRKWWHTGGATVCRLGGGRSSETLEVFVSAEEREREIAAIKREIAGVDHRLAELDTLPPQDDPIARRRAELLSEKAAKARLRDLRA
jgi:hypothetical protein